MQSQQKRVKWSRGETAEALEERTDTGVTQASVEFMENCIPDIYGNISRRPALKILENVDIEHINGFTYDEYLQVIPFYITENDIILLGIHYNGAPEALRVVDGKVVWAYYFPMITEYPTTGVVINTERTYRPISYAQQNNYLIVADRYNVWKFDFAFPTNILSQYYFTSTINPWKFSAGWYAPNGTQTRSVSDADITGFSLSGTVSNYTYTDAAGITVIYSCFNTNMAGNLATNLEELIPSGSIIQLPNVGCYFRVEGYTMIGTSNTNIMFAGTTFTGVLDMADPVPATGIYCQPAWTTKVIYIGNHQATAYVRLLRKYVNGQLEESVECNLNQNYTVKTTASTTGYSYGNFPTSTTWSGWNELNLSTLKVGIYGSLLTPIADDQATDKEVSVEYGYVSLTPADEPGVANPHPTKFVFVEQRLWAGGWAYNETEQYAVTLGSQIARYNDFKNDYNQENEPITLDILTQYKEKIVHLVDYNGLKIMTDAFEYAYNKDTGIVKQSANGSFEYCEPIVFDSLCLYVDSTGCQVKAMQYEFQSNIFNSSTINQYTPHDLVWYPWGMATYEDKIHSTGKYLFLVNREDANTRLAVCNFVPSNQANIWSRWRTNSVLDVGGVEKPLIHSVVNLKDQTMFMIRVKKIELTSGGDTATEEILPAVLDFDATTDFETNVMMFDNVGWYAIWSQVSGTTATFRTIPGSVAIYDSTGKVRHIATVSAYGLITSGTWDNTYTVGLPINSTIVSHPIDVGGKTKSIKKRIGKSIMSVHDTGANAITINNKTGYMNPRGDKISFYGVTGMKDEIKYTITNKNGAMFHLESLLMNIEYGTLDS